MENEEIIKIFPEFKELIKAGEKLDESNNHLKKFILESCKRFKINPNKLSIESNNKTIKEEK